ncbi:hypothetical protein IW22_05125 [Chryseobacterium sp. JM1]|nr:hypothetical protein IW22_05125 [Chryseobacterium sp. JM1]
MEVFAAITRHYRINGSTKSNKTPLQLYLGPLATSIDVCYLTAQKKFNQPKIIPLFFSKFELTCFTKIYIDNQ